MNNIVYIAAAGSGKTTLLVKKACDIEKPENVLILTYTDSNEDEIRKKFHKINGFIPENISQFGYCIVNLNDSDICIFSRILASLYCIAKVCFVSFKKLLFTPGCL